MRLIANDKRQLMLCKKNTLIILRVRKNFWSQWVYKYFNTSRRVSLHHKECFLICISKLKTKQTWVKPQWKTSGRRFNEIAERPSKLTSISFEAKHFCFVGEKTEKAWLEIDGKEQTRNGLLILLFHKWANIIKTGFVNRVPKRLDV